jgi:hypothetical protein
MSTVVGEVSVKVPEPIPLKGVECVAKAAGNAPRIARRPTMLMIRNFMSSKRGSTLSIRVRPIDRCPTLWPIGLIVSAE